ncbi:hypothetical protein PR002_g19722 [Phytophthora rubi]|uniref:Uncharacterized protein n=1 Tax=Phytophthora rubi TaxID=129364 RepID=A0A6A3JM61_9STRA|nr:hypothetical protein PR002_g19722 [Phytophthora rubi]
MCAPGNSTVVEAYSQVTLQDARRRLQKLAAFWVIVLPDD